MLAEVSLGALTKIKKERAKNLAIRMKFTRNTANIVGLNVK